MHYSLQTKQIDTFFTARQKCSDKVFQIVIGKSQNVSQKRDAHFQCDTLDASVLFPTQFFSYREKQNRRPGRNSKPMHDNLALEWFSFSRNV